MIGSAASASSAEPSRGNTTCERYKKKYVIPGGFIPGPNKPKIVESFLFPGLHHVAALNQRGGIPVWDVRRDTKYLSLLHILFATADGPGMTYLNGLVGHSGKIGCRLWCGLAGRHKQGAPIYYPVLFKPNDYEVAGCNHGDVDPAHVRPIDTVRYSENLRTVCASTTQSRYEKNRLETGICKPSIFSGLEPHIMGVPNMFPSDIMHLILNLADILINLWRGTLDCGPTDSKASWTWAVLQGDVWKMHGQDVANCTPYLPGSFDRPPRNPAEKINSGYKAWEFLLYLFGLGPGLFYKVLPDAFWESYCRLVYGVRIFYQKSISAEECKSAHQQLVLFTAEYEKLYVQRRKDRIHFVRQSIHNLSHMGTETVRVGPGSAYSQWTMERSIGNLTEEIKQYSKVYTHLSERGLRRSSVNALLALVPSLDKSQNLANHVPLGEKVLGDGYLLLRKLEKRVTSLDEFEATALRNYVLQHRDELPADWKAEVIRWARLRLPNGQIARSAWKERPKGTEGIRMGRMVKASDFATGINNLRKLTLKKNFDSLKTLQGSFTLPKCCTIFSTE